MADAAAEAREKMIARRFGGAQMSQTGGKGTMRRKHKAVHKTATSDDKKLGSTLKKLGVTNIPAIEEVNLFTADGRVVHFSSPKVQASIAANTYVVTGQAETKQLTELLPGIMNQLGPDNIHHLKQIADQMAAPGSAPAQDDDSDDDVPDLVENFEDVSKM
ncbi:NAC domain-containing protein [Pelagophyceae sp. CCMP2097]|nr:NAC domain-containing protein [Pelagophyceae sp. CCMP2097]|mmetsp:Transcript_11180/g.37273  ORF Transcript_11180/g.37273 Transcript_11180/m.37273 type:complete len:161 (-) Transcript_11180:33-515(-)